VSFVVAKILFLNGDCGSGIEQIGYVYAGMLTLLGHHVDMYLTQDVATQKSLAGRAKDYDIRIVNEPHDGVIPRIDPTGEYRWCAIVHSHANIPRHWIAYHMNYAHSVSSAPIVSGMFPIIYPFVMSDDQLTPTEKRPLKYLFVGRFNDRKFLPWVRDTLKKRNFQFDVGSIHGGIDSVPQEDRCLFKELKENLPIQHVYELYRQAQYLIMPSDTECLSLIVGEALANGCTPLVYDQGTVYNQYQIPKSCIFSDEASLIAALELGRVPDETFAWFHEFYSFPRTMKHLESCFGCTQSRHTTYQIFGHNDPLNKLEYKNSLFHSYRGATFIKLEGLR